MAPLKGILFVVVLSRVTCDAAVTDAQEESCADSAVKQLVQTQVNLQFQMHKAEDPAPIGSTKYLPVEVYNEDRCEKLFNVMYFPADATGICTRVKWWSTKSVKAKQSGLETYASIDCSGTAKKTIRGPCTGGYKLIASDGPMLVDLPTTGMLKYTHFGESSTQDSCQKKQAFVEYYPLDACRYSHDDPKATYIKVESCTATEDKIVFSQYTDSTCKTAKGGNPTPITVPLMCTVSNFGKTGPQDWPQQFSEQAVCTAGAAPLPPAPAPLPHPQTTYLPVEVYNDHACQNLINVMYFPADAATGICTNVKSWKSVKAKKSGLEIYASSDCSGTAEKTIRGPCTGGYKLVASDGPALVDLPTTGMLKYTHVGNGATQDSCQTKQAFVEYYPLDACRFSHENHYSQATYIKVESCTAADNNIVFSQYTDSSCKTAKGGSPAPITVPLTCTVSEARWHQQFSQQAVCTSEPTPGPTPEPSPAPPPKLAFEGWDPKGTLSLCMGDCDTDAGCMEGLKCFQRSEYTTVPGCDGIGMKDSDYCYDPELPKLPPLVDEELNPKGGGLEECSGDCDSDSECMPGLACFQRDGHTPVPGCSGKGEKGWDYCYAPVLNFVGKNPKLKLGLCSGDCDSDGGCSKGLKCKQRDADEDVPGCSGEGAPGWDYCYNPVS